jgi:chromosome segregation ATPase
MDQPGNILARGSQPAADRMRELLARTVQDQFTDQRSNAGALEDIRQRMEGLEWLVKEVREREVPGMTTQLDELSRRLEESAQKPPQWAESLAEHMELLRSQVAPVGELHSMWADVGTVSENVEVALPQLQAVCDAVGQAVEALRAQDDRLTKLQQSVGKLQQSMESAASRFSRLDKSLAELSQRTGQLDKEISAVKGRAEVSFGALTAKVDQTAEATSRQFTQSLETVSGTVEGLSGQLTNVSGQVDLVGGQIQAVHGRIERLDERLADTDDKLGSLDTRLTSTDEKIGSADTRVAGLDARLERLDERLDDQYDRVSAIGNALGGTDARLGALDSRLEQLDDQLGEHGRGLTSVEGKLGTVAGRLGMVDGKVGTLGGRFDGLETRLEGIGARVDSLGDSFGARIEVFGTRIDGLGSTVGARIDGLSDSFGTRIEGLSDTVGTRIEGLGDKFGQLDGRLEVASGHVVGVTGQLETLGKELAAVGTRVDRTAEQVAGQIEPLADELRSRPGHMDIQEILGKIVDAAQSDVATQLGSLEETVLTLAEALLRPNGRSEARVPERTKARSVPPPRDGATV